MGIPTVSDSDSVPPDTQQAIVAYYDGKFFVWDEAPCLSITPDQIYVKTDAVAINPSDTKMAGDFQNPFTVLGTDFAGTVLAIGSNVKVAISDRVCGANHGMSELRPDRGAFGQYSVTIGRV
jgi:NADPH:quinone reductase-like Zn-dependent oxidoreductase